MAVALLGRKRCTWEEETTHGWAEDGRGAKRTKRCRKNREKLIRLKEDFPDMDETTLRHVLESCGDDLEEAIHSLKALKIAAGQCEERLLAAKTAVDVGQATNPTFPNGTTPDAQAAAEGRVDAKDKQAAHAAEGRNEVERSANDWVEIVVGEMSKSADMDDARKRAANLLEKFEQDVLQASGVERERVRQLLEENTILKRAVTIQNQRIAEAAEKDREINHLRQTLSQCQEQLHKAEMNQYALAMHLRQATGEGTLDHTRFPDVY